MEVTNEPYKGFYGIVIRSSYGDELELQYFEGKQGLPYGIYWVLKEYDFDSRGKYDIHAYITCICFNISMCLQITENSFLNVD